MKRFFSYLLIYLFVVFIYLSLLPSPVQAAICGQCSQGNCCGDSCSATQHCDGDTSYGCGCAAGVNPTSPPPNTPVPTSGGGPAATGTLAPTLPQSTIIPNVTIGVNEEACGTGKCTNGFYCCQQPNGQAGCCDVGQVPPTGSGGGGGGGPTCVDWTSIKVNLCDQSEFQSNPVGSDCYTSGTNVTLNLSSSGAVWMGFANVSETTSCSTVSNATFNANRTAYGATRNWTLSSGNGNKKVCAAFSNALLSITNKCGSEIILGSAGPTNNPTPTPTAAPSSWVKLKDSSFLSANSLTSLIPLVPVAYDADDDGSANFIVGSAGIVGASAINVTGLNATAKTGNPEYKTAYTADYNLRPLTFLSYVKARKQHTTITDLSEITGPGIYVYLGTDPLDIGAPLSSVFDNNIILLTTGVVNINTDFNPNPTASVVILANQINFDSTVTQATGIFIGNDITTGVNATQGLKIVGNLVAQTSLTNDRSQSDANIPALFIVFDPQKYIDLLPYLSTANYDWHQSQ